MGMIENAKQVYSTPESIRDLSRRDYLYGAEQAILDIVKNTLPQMTVLEIGVGAGRLTKYFGLPAKEYLGIDMIPELIDISKKKFPKLSFKTLDVRNLNEVRGYDFILYGFNGLDNMTFKDRIKVLKNSYYITNYIFCFSTHIKNSIKNYKIINEAYQLSNNNKIDGLEFLHINPVYQYNLLKKIGYRVIQIYDLLGNNMTDNTAEIKDAWAYYLCYR